MHSTLLQSFKGLNVFSPMFLNFWLSILMSSNFFAHFRSWVEELKQKQYWHAWLSASPAPTKPKQSKSLQFRLTVSIVVVVVVIGL